MHLGKDFEDFKRDLERRAQKPKSKNKPRDIKGPTKKTKGGYLVNRNGKPIRKR